MSTWSHVDVYANDYDLIVNDLAHALFRGELALFLGAGVSYDFGLPGWAELVSRCMSEVSLDASTLGSTPSFDTLTRAAGKVKDCCDTVQEYHALVRAELYRDAKDRDRAQPSSLLTALGALMMGSRRGRIREVWTLNYDDVLEWYLRVHGFISQAISHVPTVLRDVDVTTYHPHGFLPLDVDHFKASSEIVFDDTSYGVRSVGKAQEWRDAVQNALKSRIFLSVGLSWTDQLLRNLIIEAKSANKERPTAFWFFGHDVSEDDMEDCLREPLI